MVRCNYCNRVLTHNEYYYYGHTCDDCESIIWKYSDDLPMWRVRLKCRMKRLSSIFKRRKHE